MSTMAAIYFHPGMPSDEKGAEAALLLRSDGYAGFDEAGSAESFDEAGVIPVLRDFFILIGDDGINAGANVMAGFFYTYILHRYKISGMEVHADTDEDFWRETMFLEIDDLEIELIHPDTSIDTNIYRVYCGDSREMLFSPVVEVNSLEEGEFTVEPLKIPGGLY